jgi:FMN phosphatase YigB (HAD superfamily)
MRLTKTILTDVDGVLLDWEYSFDIYLQTQGFQKVPGGDKKYNIGKRYGIDPEEGKKLIKIFNESAAIGFLPPLRDAMYYVRKLHKEHGYVFHAITSLSKDKNAQELRKMNLRHLFGKNTFEKFVFLDTGEDKDIALERYRNQHLFWIEDKIVNAQAGQKLGLKPILMTHEHSEDFEDHAPINKIFKVNSWKEIYEYVLENDYFLND